MLPRAEGLRRTLRYANLVLLILFPVAWAAPLMRAGLLPLFGLSEISVLSGIASLWQTDIVLALVVAVFALVAPIAKTAGLAAIQFGLAPPRLLPAIALLGKLAMADIFLIAIYITLAKGIGVGRVEPAWGLYLFTFCILASLALSHLAARDARRG
ncbi:MAG: paraquat-inducible protein A [Paracoccaceae bacterium]